MTAPAEAVRLRPSLPRRLTVRSAAAALITVQAAWWASIALPGYFRTDDYFYFGNAADAGLWEWLGRVYWEHFAPGHRLAFWLLGTATPQHWLLLQLLLVAAFALGLACLYGSLELLFGRSWWLLVPLAVTGFAWQYSFGFAWPSAGLQVLPEFVFGTVALYAFLRHLQSEQWRWLALSVLAFTVGLAFYIRVGLVLLVLVLVRYVFLQRELAPRALMRAVWDDRLRWLVFLFPAALYVSYFWQRHVFESPPPDGVAQVAGYVRIAWTRNVAPGFVGVRMHPGDANTLIVVAAQLSVAALVVLSLLRKGTASLRAWAYVALIVGATFWLTARGKVGVLGAAGAGYDPRYGSDLCWMLPLGAVFALHPRRVLELGVAWPASRRSPVAVVAVACGVAVTLALAMHSAHAQEQDWQGERARAWVENVRDGLADPAMRVRDGASPAYVGGGYYRDLFPLLGEPGRVGAGANAVVLADGRIRARP